MEEDVDVAVAEAASVIVNGSSDTMTTIVRKRDVDGRMVAYNIVRGGILAFILRFLLGVWSIASSHRREIVLEYL